MYFPDSVALRRYDPTTYQVETLFGPEPGWDVPADGALGASRIRGGALPVPGASPDELFLLEGQGGLRHLDGSGRLTTLSGPAGIESGYVDGEGESARVGSIPGAVRLGGEVFFADSTNCAIRAVSFDPQAPAGSTTRTLVGGPAPAVDCRSVDGVGSEARTNRPSGLAAIDRTLYFSERSGNRVRALDLDTLEVTTVAGSGTDAVVDGIGSAASFSQPGAIAAGADGAIYVVDGRLWDYSDSHVLRRLDPATGEVVTVAGRLGTGWDPVDGIGTDARVGLLVGLSAASDAGLIYMLNQRGVVRFDVNTREVSTLFQVAISETFEVAAPGGAFATPAEFSTFTCIGAGSFAINQYANRHLLRLELP